LIDPEILEFERQFAVQRGGLQEVVLGSSSELEGDEIESDIEGGRSRSVVSLDSITQNADFVNLID
jgi:hypothetical protein